MTLRVSSATSVLLIRSSTSWRDREQVLAGAAGRRRRAVHRDADYVSVDDRGGADVDRDRRRRAVGRGVEADDRDVAVVGERAAVAREELHLHGAGEPGARERQHE